MTPDKLDEMVRLWVDLFLAFATAHSREEIERADFKQDELLRPLLEAPIAQVREWASRLASGLEAEPRMPFAIHSEFRKLVEGVLSKALDEGERQLKEEIAGKIAAMVAEKVAPQLGEAIQGALKWRDPKQLERIEKAAAKGATPKLTGRQSCLFLSMEDEETQTADLVML